MLDCPHCIICEACKMELSPRETEIMREICHGHSNKKISVQMSLSEKTVKNHISRIFQKLHVDSRQKVLVIALKRNLITIDEITI